MSDIPVELTDPTAELAEAMRARMGITDEGGENEKQQEPAEKVEDPNHDDANQPVVEGSGGAVPRMGADGGGGGQEAEPPVEVEDVPEFIQFGSIRIPRSQEQELEQLYRWAQEQILSAPVAPPAGQQQPAPLADPPAPAFNPEDFVDPDLARVVDERFTQSLDPITQQLDLLLQAEQRREREAFEQHQIVLNAPVYVNWPQREDREPFRHELVERADLGQLRLDEPAGIGFRCAGAFHYSPNADPYTNAA